MSQLQNVPKVKMWLASPLPRDVAAAIERLAEIPDVRHVAVLPDVHLAGAVCVGLAVATERLIIPDAVGGDIGCGMVTAALDVSGEVLAEERNAKKLLAELRVSIPIIRHGRTRPAPVMSAELARQPLSDSRLETIRRRDGCVQFGTLGRGNHFLEFQADEDDRLWILAHSGSRAMGPAIRDLHLANAQIISPGLKALEADSLHGKAYLSDSAWACRYATESRRAMLLAATEAAGRVFSAKIEESSILESDHNHVRNETHFGKSCWVHRKGSASAMAGEMGILPGSMGTVSFHVQGRGSDQSLHSSAHGAGRALTRDQARRQITVKDLLRQASGVWIDSTQAEHLREEAPSAYKDIRRVLRAQRELVKVIRKLRPVLNYKGAE